jgi:transposase
MSEVIREVLAREAALQAVVRVGVDLAKRVIQVHAVDRAGKVLSCARCRESSRRGARNCPPAASWPWRPAAVRTTGAAGCGCVGLDVRLVAGHFVSPYRMQGKRGKNNANDAAAICETASRPHMRFVPVKSAEQQGWLAVHRLREGFKEERTACINRIRGLLAEFGLVFPKRPELLRQALPPVLEDMNNELPDIGRLALQQALLHWIELDCRLAWCDERRGRARPRRPPRAGHDAAVRHRPDHRARRWSASVDDFEQLRRAPASSASWIGLPPSQNSSGGKVNLGRITKRGDTYLRTLLVQGARSAVQTAHQRSDRLSRWLLALRERRGRQKAAVALGNKNARFVWAVLTRGECFDPGHGPKPQAPNAPSSTPPCLRQRLP